QAEDGIRDRNVTGVQTCALPICIIEYTVTVRAAGGTTRTGLFRLATTLPDCGQAPAADLAALYHQRREAENGYAEIKTRLRGARSEERRVGKEWRAGGWRDDEKK